jgi:sulfoxide reductase heme-binding subunit YedZ
MRAFIFLLALLPLDRLIWLGFTDGLGANPIEFITRSTGTWALVFLCLTLLMTPLRLITNLSAWIRYRRMLGLFSFFYACLHFVIWLWLDQDFDLAGMLKDVLKRPFITMGFISFMLLIPLALTSNHWAQRKLGRRWAQLHRIIYFVAGTIILHYWWHKAGKNDVGTVSIYAGVLALLLCCRIPYIRQRLRLHSPL